MHGSEVSKAHALPIVVRVTRMGANLTPYTDARHASSGDAQRLGPMWSGRAVPATDNPSEAAAAASATALTLGVANLMFSAR
jgi:hypothetical protein